MSSLFGLIHIVQNRFSPQSCLCFWYICLFHSPLLAAYFLFAFICSGTISRCSRFLCRMFPQFVITVYERGDISYITVICYGQWLSCQVLMLFFNSVVGNLFLQWQARMTHLRTKAGQLWDPAPAAAATTSSPCCQAMTQMKLLTTWLVQCRRRHPTTEHCQNPLVCGPDPAYMP